MTHRAKRTLLTAVLVPAVVLVPVAVAYTYTLLGPPRHWASIPVKIYVTYPGHVSITSGDTDGGVTATIQALNGTHPSLVGEGWNVTSAGQVVDAVSSFRTWALGDGFATIAFSEKIPGTCSGSCLAATFIGYYNCSQPFSDGHCTIVDADVETRRNSADRFGGPYYSLYEPCRSNKEWNIEAIMVHEVGHILGIGHSAAAGATMYPSVSSCSSGPATIESDDAAALDALYPPP